MLDKIAESDPIITQNKIKIFSTLLYCSSMLSINFSFFMVLFCLLFLLSPLFPVDLELVMGPIGAVGVGAPSGFTDDESCPSTQEASPSSSSVFHPFDVCLPLSVIMLRERWKNVEVCQENNCNSTNLARKY